MKRTVPVAILALAATIGGARAQTALPLASHRAAYEITLADSASAETLNSQTPIGASGLIAYEFTGSACQGYASNFRQVTELQRSEGEALSSDVRALTYEDGDGASMRFQVDSQTAGDESPQIVGSAKRSAAGEVAVALTKPAPQSLDLGKDILFPTEHIEHIIAQAKQGGGTMQARVFDGSDSGKKVFVTMTVIGKLQTAPTPETAFAEALSSMRRWPVTVSYFDEAARDAPPEYVLSFDLYENGISGSLKLDYGPFALAAKLSKLEMLPTPVCAK
jgi:hypothetical protein